MLDFTLTSDGEINPLEALESKLKGPYAVADRSLSSIVPFSLSKASYYLDGETATKDEIEEDAVVVYYNTTTKCIYGYSENAEGGRGACEDVYKRQAMQAMYGGSMLWSLLQLAGFFFATDWILERRLNLE